MAARDKIHPTKVVDIVIHNERGRRIASTSYQDALPFDEILSRLSRELGDLNPHYVGSFTMTVSVVR